jgi:hypothetical protein
MRIPLTSPRYVVTELSGFLSIARGKARPGTSFQVIDTLWNHRLIAMWRTEDFGRGGTSAREKARSRCEALAAKLNGATPVAVVPRRNTKYMPFRPSCPRAECGVRCDVDALYCVECGTRLYTLESGRYGGKS